MSQKIQIKITNKMKYDYIMSLLCYGMVVCLYKTSTPFDQITTLTYILLDISCTCFQNTFTFPMDYYVKKIC